MSSVADVDRKEISHRTPSASASAVPHVPHAQFDAPPQSLEGAPIRFDEAFMATPKPPSGSAGEGSRPIRFDEAISSLSTPQPESGRLFQRPQGEPAPAQRANFWASVKAGLVEDEATKRRLIAESVFPGDPTGIDRVGFVGGVPAYVDDSGEVRKVSPGLVRFGADIVANSPEAAGGAVGAMAGPVGATAGAVGARGIKRGLAGLVFDEPQTFSGNLKDLGVEGALNLGSAAVGKGVSSFLDRGKAIDFAPSNMRAAEQTVTQTQRNTGISLDLAQASGDRKLIALRAYAARFPGKSAEIIQAADDMAQGQFETATNRVLNLIAKSKPAEVAGANGINAARLVLDTIRARRDNAVAPFYEAAYKNTLSADVVEELAKDPVLASLAARVSKDPVFARDLRGAPRDSLKFWHYVKQAADDQIEKNANEPNRVRILTQARKDLSSKLEAASPEYAQANSHYAKVTSELLEPLENSAVGVLSRITNPKAASAAAKIFSDANITPQEITNARSAISAQNPDAWADLTRQWLAQRFNRALRETQTGEVVNPAGRFRQAVFGTPADQARMRAMLPSASLAAFEDLMKAAERLASTPIAGSNTMRDTEIKDQLKGTTAVMFRWLTTPRQAIRDAAEQRALESGTVQIAEALVDPQRRAQLRQVARMAPSTRQAILISSILAGQMTQRAAARDGDQPPPLSLQSVPR